MRPIITHKCNLKIRYLSQLYCEMWVKHDVKHLFKVKPISVIIINKDIKHIKHILRWDGEV